MSEASFLKKLASNERPVREGAVESLKQYLSRDKKLTLLKYQKLWKGLFYAMWFSDRPRPQQRLAQTVANLFSETIPLKSFNTFVEAFWTVIIREWPGLDYHRVDKFYLLLRKVINSCFERLRTESWELKIVESYFETLRKNVLSGSLKVPSSLPLHVIDVYCDELEKVIFSEIDDSELANEDLDEEAREELVEKIKNEKKAIVKEVPLDYMFNVFNNVKNDTEIKPLKKKIDEDLFEDERIKEWEISVENKKEKEELKGDDEEDDFQ